MKRIFRIFHKKTQNKCNCSLHNKESRNKVPKEFACTCFERGDIHTKGSGRDKSRHRKLRVEASESTITDLKHRRPTSGRSFHEIKHKKVCDLNKKKKMTIYNADCPCMLSQKKSRSAHHLKNLKRPSCRNVRQQLSSSGSEGSSTEKISSMGTTRNCVKSISSCSLEMAKSNRTVHVNPCHHIHRFPMSPGPSGMNSARGNFQRGENSRKHSNWCSQARNITKFPDNQVYTVAPSSEMNKPRAGILKNRIVPLEENNPIRNFKSVVKVSRGTSPLRRVEMDQPSTTVNSAQIENRSRRHGVDTYIYHSQIEADDTSDSSLQVNKRKSDQPLRVEEKRLGDRDKRRGNIDSEEENSAIACNKASVVDVLRKKLANDGGKDTPAGFLRLPKDPKMKAEILNSLKAAGIQYRIPNNKK